MNPESQKESIYRQKTLRGERSQFVLIEHLHRNGVKTIETRYPDSITR